MSDKDEAFARDGIDQACNDWWKENRTGICYHETRRLIYRAGYTKGGEDQAALVAELEKALADMASSVGWNPGPKRKQEREQRIQAAWETATVLLARLKKENPDAARRAVLAEPTTSHPLPPGEVGELIKQANDCLLDWRAGRIAIGSARVFNLFEQLANALERLALEKQETK